MKANEVIKFTKKQYTQLASLARGLIVQDMERGVLQGGKKRYSTKNSNVGWRTINGKPVFIDSYKNKKARRFEPVRPKNLIGKPLNEKTSNVNMILTGETKNRIRPEGKKNKGVLVFERANIIKGNERHGYIITTLNSKNKKKARNFLDRIVDRNIKKYESKPVKIKAIG